MHYFYAVNFLYPAFLIAACAIALPVIVHLFNFKRYKKVLFSDIRLLQEIKEQTNKSSQLKHLLTLLMRIGAILSLVLAFAQPFFGDSSLRNKGKKALSIFIDNSYSMGVQQNGVPLLELAKSKAKDIINACSSKDQFQILTQELTGSDSRFLNKEEALAQLAQITVCAQSRDAASVLQKQQNNLQTSDATVKQIIYVSDMQKNKCTLPIATKINTHVSFVPVQQSTRANVSIDSAWFVEPSITMNAPNTINVRVRNYDNEKPIETTVNVGVNNQVKTVRNVSLKPGENKIESLPFTAVQSGWQNIQLHLSDYPVSFDDTFYMAGKVAAQQSVLLVSEGVTNPYLNAAFKTGAAFRTDVSTPGAAIAKKLDNYSLVVCSGLNTLSSELSNVLQSYCSQGGSVCIFPGASINTSSYNAALSILGGAVFGTQNNSPTNVSSVNKQHELIRDIFDKVPDNVDLPKVEKCYALNGSTFSSEQKIFSFANGDAFLSSYRVGNGKVYVCATGLEAGSSNFANSYWFLPAVFKMAFIGGKNPIHAYTLGKDAVLTISGSKAGDANPFHLSNATWDAIPQQRNVAGMVQVNLNQSATHAGLYNLNIPNSDAENYVVGLNYNRQESNLDCWATNELSDKAKLANFDVVATARNAADAIGENAQGSPVWKYCLIAALVFLLLEILLVRLWR
ncbi:MAG: hypothetical protein RL660_939 [Bacteroidota bacterium]|jgi:hypothetical protein